MHSNEVERAIEGIFSSKEQDRRLTGEETKDLLLAIFSAIIAALSKRATEAKASGAKSTFIDSGAIITIGLERAILHLLFEFASHLLKYDVQEVEE